MSVAWVQNVPNTLALAFVSNLLFPVDDEDVDKSQVTCCQSSILLSLAANQLQDKMREMQPRCTKILSRKGQREKNRQF